MMRWLFAFLLIGCCCTSSVADRPIFLVTPGGLWQSIVSDDGVPGQWKKVDAEVIFSGFGDKIQPSPQPIPEPEPDPVAKTVRLSVIMDADNISQPVASVLNGIVAWDDLRDSGSEYRFFDIKTDEPDGKKAIQQLSGSAPGIVISTKDTGAVIHKGPLPGTFADLKALVRRLTGG